MLQFSLQLVKIPLKIASPKMVVCFFFKPRLVYLKKEMRVSKRLQ